jgi:hypothetical protein
MLALAEWDLVWLSDSSGRGAGELYAAYVEEDLGVTVTLHDLALGSLSARSVRNALLDSEGRAYDLQLRGLPDLIREAEVVVLYANPTASISETHPGDWSCTPGPKHVVDCSPETFDAYLADLDDIYAEIFRLRGGSPTLVRAFDAYNPLLSEWRADGVLDACLGCWENYNQAIHQAAEAHGVPVAGVFEAFNGADHRDDPRDAGYIDPDGIHTSGEGQTVIADLLRELGYAVTAP